MKIKRRLFCAVILLLLASVAPALAQDGDAVTDDDVNRVARQLYCPQCENVTLDVCGTTACIAWRKEIRERLAGGWTDEEIIDYFKAQYGQRVLAQPDDPLISLLLAAIPIAAIVVGVVFVVVQQRKGRGRDVTPAPDGAKDASVKDEYDEYRARLERELNEPS
ncbi:MAG: cytochrome c-type biogenesis protein CcmH [Anaerolineae bacterium]|nr:cytochrome c-type biogenesis protein CcmH [Anaerolineae bacterium]